MIRYLKNIFHLINAFFSCIYYRFPAHSIKVIGITGTSGKTTTTHLIYQILKCANMKVSMISTVEAIINGERLDTGFHVTTPSPFLLQKLLRQAADGGSQYVILEVTSHALDQFRIFGIPFHIAVITNITHEHLDYHKTFISYRDTKAKILESVQIAVLNADDNNFGYLKKYIHTELITFGMKGMADVNPSTIHIQTVLPGEFNMYNCLAAASVGIALGIKKKTIVSAIKTSEIIPGRMQEVETKNNFRVIIDFAHKPDALMSVLSTLRGQTDRKLIVVFGCAGERDRMKRSMMGEIAGKIADYTVLTAEDPRTEDVRVIIGEIAKGCLKSYAKEADKRKNPQEYLKRHERYFWRIPDRQEAINFAVRKLAHNGDIVLVTGKGHEQSMCYGKIEYPWDEFSAVTKALYGTVKIITKVQ